MKSTPTGKGAFQIAHMHQDKRFASRRRGLEIPVCRITKPIDRAKTGQSSPFQWTYLVDRQRLKSLAA
jgi:hypothetical protein